jgi:hypothetical protein
MAAPSRVGGRMTFARPAGGGPPAGGPPHDRVDARLEAAHDEDGRAAHDGGQGRVLPHQNLGMPACSRMLVVSIGVVSITDVVTPEA